MTSFSNKPFQENNASWVIRITWPPITVNVWRNDSESCSRWDYGTHTLVRLLL